MALTYLIVVVFIVLLIILLLRYFLLRKKNVPSTLYTEALRNENSGHYKEALLSYENALQEVKRSRFRDTSLENTIIEKLKVLNTTIEYEQNIQLADRRI